MVVENVLTQHIEKTPGVVGGKARIVGTRIRVMDIVIWYEKHGRTADEVVDMFSSITLADVHAAMAYYFDHREEIEQDFKNDADYVSEMKAKYPSLLKEKLHRGIIGIVSSCS
jgi:uncharacterized protein (DUF433 family)